MTGKLVGKVASKLVVKLFGKLVNSTACVIASGKLFAQVTGKLSISIRHAVEKLVHKAATRIITQKM